MSHILDGVPFHEISEDHLNSLKLLRITESPRLEFKQTLSLSSSGEKRELCKDISALANSLGGYILFGISEGNGAISDVPGIDFNESISQQFSQVITSGISPRIQKYDLKVIALRNGKNVLLVKIEPDGYLHQVKYDDNRFYKRTGTITIAMESSDAQSFFSSKERSSRKDEVDDFISNYHAELRGRKYFKGVPGKGICAIAIVPEVSSYKIDFGNLPHNISLLFQPMNSYGWDSEITGKARFTFGTHRDAKSPYSVTEITELGQVKAFNSWILENRYHEVHGLKEAIDFVPSIAYERELITSVHQYLTSLTQLNISPPFFVNCSLLSVRGYFMYADPNRFSHFGRKLSQDDIVPATVRFESNAQFATRDEVATFLKPTFDFIWREFGFDRSFNYNGNGKWVAEY